MSASIEDGAGTGHTFSDGRRVLGDEKALGDTGTVKCSVERVVPNTG